MSTEIHRPPSGTVTWDDNHDDVHDAAHHGHHGDSGDSGEHIHLAPESIWPITMAFGITIAGSSLVTNWLMLLPGLTLFVWALYQWVQELLVDGH